MATAALWLYSVAFDELKRQVLLSTSSQTFDQPPLWCLSLNISRAPHGDA